jgi:phenylalanyl-tRNA synthetase beta chain
LVTPPSWRPDLRDKSDLAEEVARIVGYDRIPSVLPVAPPGRGLTRAQRLRRAVSQMLADNGATEVLSFPFVSEHDNDLFGAAEPGGVRAVKLANALDATTPYLRTSLLPGLIDAAKRNLARGLVDLSLYETGTVFLPGDGPLGAVELPVGAELPSEETLAALNAGIPHQPRHLAGLVLGNGLEKQPGVAPVAAGLSDALDMVRQAAAAVGAEVHFVQGRHQALHPGRTALVVATGADGSETTVGFAGELLPALAAELDLPRVVAVFELDLDLLLDVAPTEVLARVIAGLPAATQDLSLVVPSDAPAGDVLRAVRDGAGALLEDIRLVDDYRGAGIAPGNKSLTFALRFRAEDRTLTAAEASEAKLAGAARAGELFGATIRE